MEATGMCSAFIIYGRADSRNTAAINFFVKYPLSAGRARRTDGKRPADRCGQGEKQIPGIALQPYRERLREYEDQKVTTRRALRALP